MSRQRNGAGERESVVTVDGIDVYRKPKHKPAIVLGPGPWVLDFVSMASSLRFAEDEAAIIKTLGRQMAESLHFANIDL